ncbi:MAG: peptidylprolyl isomerase [Pseudolabrys sp.]|nr:peptidylprolyl isomerase [Pseudolabrys sp.]
MSWTQYARLLVALAVFCVFAGSAHAQVVAIVNGAPITTLDIEQRTKLDQITTNKAITRQQVINELIDDRLKLAIAKRYAFEVGENEIEEAYSTMAKRARMTPEQLTQMLSTRGASAGVFKAKIRADLTWQQLVRGRFQASLQVGDADVNNILKSRGATGEDTNFSYTLYPIVFVIPSGSGEALLDQRRREAESLRSRFQNCNDGLKLARALRDVAVREPITRSSGDLTPQLRELLSKMELGQVTTPESASQGLQMFALCDKKQAGTNDSAAKREARDELFAKRFEAEGNKWLKELRSQAMIEYR